MSDPRWPRSSQGPVHPSWLDIHWCVDLLGPHQIRGQQGWLEREHDQGPKEEYCSGTQWSDGPGDCVELLRVGLK